MELGEPVAAHSDFECGLNGSPEFCLLRSLLGWNPSALYSLPETPAGQRAHAACEASMEGCKWPKDTHAIETDLTKAYDRTRCSTLSLELLDKAALG